jgi:hypothetical protein
MRKPVDDFHAKMIRTKMVVQPDQIREEQEIVSNDNGIIKRKYRIQTKKRRTNVPKHVSFAVPTDVSLSNPIDRMPTPFVPEIQFVVNKRNVSKKQSKRRSKKGRRKSVDPKKK